MGTEYGGIIGEILTDTTLDYVEAKGLSWRGRLAKKIIEPPVGSDYKTVSGELHTVMKELIEPEFDGLFVVSQEDTGVTVSNYQFDRYCTLYDGIVKMLKSKGYRLQLSFRREQNELGYLYIEAVPIVDYSNRVELSKDCKLNYTMDDKRDGVNHLIVTGKGELQDRNILHLYVQENGEIGTKKHYTGLQEIAEVYENTSTETDELMSAAEDRLRSLAGKKTFKMDVAKLGIDVGIGDIVGGRDYLTGLYMAKPVENIVYEIINDVESKTYKLEGDGEE
ncbi:siphovirus ReqiPepy6 Gp37-like family protein [[Ruminococcus] torques]|nr:siphovirus ReqiPepy6 Gp37-like family protein [[Ruminococcus] torques]